MALKILLADDSMIAQNLGKKILTDAGHEVIAVSNGAAAVKKIAELKPQLAILDIYMPGYTGLEVCERIKNSLETANMPVLLTVGKMEPYRPEDGARVKAEGVIIKPFEGSDLIAAVSKLEEKLSEAKPAPAPKVEAAEEAEDVEAIEEQVTAAEAAAPVHDMSLPAFGFDELPVEAPPAMAQAVGAGVGMAMASTVAEAPTFAVDAAASATHADPFPPLESHPALADFSHFHIPEESTTAAVAQPAIRETTSTTEAAGTASMADWPAVTSQSATFDVPAIEDLRELEFTAAPKVEVEAQPTIELEPTILQESVGESTFAVDPALVTDPAEIVEFVTRFGTDEPQEPAVELPGDDAIAELEVPFEGADLSAHADLTEVQDITSEATTAEHSTEDLVAGLPELTSTDELPKLDDLVVPELTTTPEPAPAIPDIAPVADAAQWQATEETVGDAEAATSLDEEMQRAFASFDEKLDVPLPVSPTEFEEEAAIPAVEAQAVNFGAIEPVMDTVPAPAISGDPELAAAMESALASLDAHDVPETLIELPELDTPASADMQLAPEAAATVPVAEPEAVQEPEPTFEHVPAEIEGAFGPAEHIDVTPTAEPALNLESEPAPPQALETESDSSKLELAVPELVPEPSASAAVEPEGVVDIPLPEAEPEMLEEIESEIMRRAAMTEPTVSVVDEQAATAAAPEEARVAAAVARVMERMKSHIVAEIVKELQGE